MAVRSSEPNGTTPPSDGTARWHFDDFIAAAEWLIQTGRTQPERLAIFGGSNSGLLVGAAMTQRPDLFRAVVCMVPMLDMLRYHLFDNAHVWKDEFGTAEDPDDFRALLELLAVSQRARWHRLSGHDDRLRRFRPELQSTARAKDDGAAAGRQRVRTSDIPRLQPTSRAFPGVASERTN